MTNHNMHQLIQNMIADLNDHKTEILGDQYPEDQISEYVDSWTPIYNAHLAELLANCPSLGDGPDDSGLVVENPTVWNILTAAIYEKLSQEAHEWLYEAQQNATPFHVVGIDEDDGNATILEEFNNSGEAKEWLLRYASKEDAGGWKRLEVLDTREECAETVFSWNAEEIAA